MTQHLELDALILRNLGDLDGAARRVETLSEDIWRGLFEPFAAWAAEHSWKTCAVDDDTWWAAPESWRDPDADDDDGFAAYFEFAYGEGDSGQQRAGEDYFELTRLMGAGGGRMGLEFRQTLLKPAKWKALRASRSDLVEAIAETVPIDGKGSFYLPCKLDPEATILALEEGDFSEAARPLIEALERLERARGAFERLIAAMKSTD